MLHDESLISGELRSFAQKIFGASGTWAHTLITVLNRLKFKAELELPLVLFIDTKMCFKGAVALEIALLSFAARPLRFNCLICCPVIRLGIIFS